jgi:hypothetical protein
LVVGVTVLTTGCSGRKRVPEYSEIKGQVTFKGTPLPGGELAFHSTQEGVPAATAVIDESGNYSIRAPQGEVKITVDNEMLRPGSGARQHAPSQMKGAGPRPGGTDPTVIKGKHVPISPKYRSLDATDLKYTVTKGEQTKNIELTE